LLFAMGRAMMLHMDITEVRVSRSGRRKKTVAARLVDDGRVLEVLAPAGMSDSDLAPVIEKLKGQIVRRTEHAARMITADDAGLSRRATELNRELFGGKLHWSEIRYVTNQHHRFGSCTPSTGRIRISLRLAALPSWVRDYVIVHELAHLVEANHGQRFWKMVERYARTERARGYLMALGLEPEGDDGADLDDAGADPLT
jgi:predicted metal-dependent hydrolase